MARHSAFRNGFHVATRMHRSTAIQSTIGDSASAAGMSLRFLNIFSVFSKEAREKERARLKDEMNRGYFDDLRDLKKTGGKVGTASQKLVPVLAAGKFPLLTAYTKTGDLVSLPFEKDSMSTRATLVCMAFRGSGQNMINSWIEPFSSSYESASNVELVQVSVVESWFLSLPPIKYILLRVMQAPTMADGSQPFKNWVLYTFGDTYFFRKELGIPNVLVGYLFLLDKKGRVRWRASGVATSEELSSMNSCILHLLEEN